MKPNYYMVFDVESLGLHGSGFAAGWVVVDNEGKEHDSGLACTRISEAMCSRETWEWLQTNVPAMPTTHESMRGVRQAFWDAWQRWKANGAVLVADCAWPVEARFLAQCVDDVPASREWTGPYPLHDLASMLLAVGKDPLATYDRLPGELPAHHPLNDARQSARLLIEALASTSQTSVAREAVAALDGQVDAMFEEL